MVKTIFAKHPLTWTNVSLFILAMAILCLMYFFQRFDFFSRVFGSGISSYSYLPFIFNKTLRLIMNDVACFILIYILFPGKKYLKAAFWVFLFELFVLLPIYFVFKLSLEGDGEISSPLLSQLHRLII